MVAVTDSQRAEPETTGQTGKVRKMTGYGGSAYAHSLAEFGRPIELPACGGWILERPILGGFVPGGSTLRDPAPSDPALSDSVPRDVRSGDAAAAPQRRVSPDAAPDDRAAAHADATGCYPIFACADWSGLAADLAGLDRPLVSLVLVTDPFAAFDPQALHGVFPDLMREFNEHYVVDLTVDPNASFSRHHERASRRALAHVDVVEESEPAAFLDEWLVLYESLLARHAPRGMRAFSPAAFEAQLGMAEAVVFSARMDGRLVGAQIWLLANDVAYGHVQAVTPEGLEKGAGYALYARALELLRTRASWADLGGVPGGAEGDGLRTFKQGWATATRPTYLCGRILDREVYAQLARAAKQDGYFPAYRDPAENDAALASCAEDGSANAAPTESGPTEDVPTGASRTRTAPTQDSSADAGQIHKGPTDAPVPEAEPK